MAESECESQKSQEQKILADQRVTITHEGAKPKPQLMRAMKGNEDPDNERRSLRSRRSEIRDPRVGQIQVRFGLTFPRRSLLAFEVGGEQLKAAVMMQNYNVNMGLQLIRFLPDCFALLSGHSTFH